MYHIHIAVGSGYGQNVMRQSKPNTFEAGLLDGLTCLGGKCGGSKNTLRYTIHGLEGHIGGEDM